MLSKDFSNGLALFALVSIFALECFEQAWHSRFVQSICAETRKIKWVSEMEHRLMGHLSPKGASKSAAKQAKRDIERGETEPFVARSQTQRATKRTPKSSSNKKSKCNSKIQTVLHIDTVDKTLIPSAKKKKFESVNTYDLFKLFSTLMMFTDHYGYMGLPGIYGEKRHWLRIYGRAAAPGFFFLCGYSSKRFRLRVWIAALFLYFFTVHYFLDIVYTPFESILTVALINAVYKHLAPHRVLSHPLASIVVFAFLAYFKDFASKELRIGYGTHPFILAIAGDMIRHKHRLRIPWVVGAMVAFAYSSIVPFSRSNEQTYWIIGESAINGLAMIFFSLRDVPLFDHLPEPLLSIVRGGIKWLSRQGLYVYVGHLMLYRLISLVDFYNRRTKKQYI